MKISWPKSFVKEYYLLPKDMRRRFDEKIQLFESNPGHPSLRVKKISGTENIWEASISKSYRWTFDRIYNYRIEFLNESSEKV